MKKSNDKSYHFIGIGGCGMAPLARILNNSSYKVRGSDIKPSETTEKLQSDGIQISFSHNPQNIDPKSTVVISSAIKADNSELLFAQSQGLEVLHRSDLLKQITEKKKTITVSGTHGKTTTSAILTHLLEQSEKKVLGIVGGKMYNPQTSHSINDSNIVVAEADESDGTFLKYNPSISILTNLELDHLDYYKTEENLINFFSKHLKNLGPTSTLIYNNDCPKLKALAQNFSGHKISFGLSSNSCLSVQNISFKDHKIYFSLKIKSVLYACELNSLGYHNILNAIAAIAAIYAMGLDVERACFALSSFKGVARRLDLLLDTSHLKIYNDYAHNPGKIKATIQALQKSYKEYMIHVLFEPHRYSRLDTMYKDFIFSLSSADLVTVLPVFSAGESNVKNLCIEKFAKDLARYSNIKTEAVYNNNDAILSCLKNRKEKTIILTLGAGDITTLAYKIKEKMLC